MLMNETAYEASIRALQDYFNLIIFIFIINYF